MTETQRPDWLKPGAEVLIWSDDYGRDVRGVTTTTVTKVWAKTFLVDDHADKFEIEGLKSRPKGTWARPTLCAPVDSDRARTVLEKLRHQNLMWDARMAVEAWGKQRTRENRLAAIAALQAIEVDEEAS